MLKDIAKWILSNWSKLPLWKKILGIAAIIFIFFLGNISTYLHTCWKADKIYSECLSNVQELKLIFEEEHDLENIDYAKYRFSVVAYDNGFTTSERHLNKTLNNFYTNLKKIDIFKTKRDFDITIGQGNDILAKFNVYFGCKDYFDYIEKLHDRPRASSESTVGVRFNLKGYITYRFRSIKSIIALCRC